MSGLTRLYLRLSTSDDDVIPILLAFCAVNGDLRLFSEYMYRVCREGSGGVKRIACRYLEHLATVKEPLAALERLADEVSGGSLLKDVARSLRLGVDPSEVSERLMESITSKLRVKATTADEFTRVILESIALFATVFMFAFALTSVLVGASLPYYAVIPIVGIFSVITALFIPNVVALAAPRLHPLIILSSIASLVASMLSIVFRSHLMLVLSLATAIPAWIATIKWWRETRLVAETALALTESMQFGLSVHEYSLYAKLGYAKFSNLARVFSELLHLAPQEGSVTATRLLRQFAEFALRYLDVAKSVLTKSVLYETVVAVTIPTLALLTNAVVAALQGQGINGMTAAKTPGMVVGVAGVRLGLSPGVFNEAVFAMNVLVSIAPVYSLVASKVGRGTYWLPLLHWLAPLLMILLS